LFAQSVAAVRSLARIEHSFHGCEEDLIRIFLTVRADSDAGRERRAGR